MKNWYQLTESETLDKLGVTSEGLSSQQADSLLEKHGKNALEESKKKSVFQVFLSQFADLMVIILIIAAIVSMFSGSVESTIVIFAVITLNAILGTVQHVKAEKSLESLKSLSSPSAKVIRDGRKLKLIQKTSFPATLLCLRQATLLLQTEE